MWRGKFKVWSVKGEWKVQSVKSVECKVWSEECAKCRVWWSVECAVWSVECGV